MRNGDKKQLRLALTSSGIHLEPPGKEVWHTCVDGLKVCQHALYILLVRTLQLICVAKTKLMS